MCDCVEVWNPGSLDLYVIYFEVIDILHLKYHTATCQDS